MSCILTKRLGKDEDDEDEIDRCDDDGQAEERGCRRPGADVQSDAV
jgi:hypothetical protein